MTYIKTDQLSDQYRAKAVDLSGRRLLVSNFRNSGQEQDLTIPPNCDGFGRIHHFRRSTTPGWPSNVLPIDPACARLGLGRPDTILAQVFQNAVCNWRCWYCFVPFNLLSASPEHSEWVSPQTLIDLYLRESDRAPLLDLTGGQPDLVPEWVPWMMREIRDRGLEREIYLWSDDNLSTDYFWRYLSDADRELIASYPCYGRVCCFKGFDAESFAFNTKAAPELFDRQFELMRRLLTVGMDLYAYTTFTAPADDDIEVKMARFVDRLQDLHPNLPLRTVPLEIRVFSPVAERMNAGRQASLGVQWRAIEAWQRELVSRFSEDELALPVVEVPLR